MSTWAEEGAGGDDGGQLRDVEAVRLSVLRSLALVQLRVHSGHSSGFVSSYQESFQARMMAIEEQLPRYEHWVRTGRFPRQSY